MTKTVYLSLIAGTTTAAELAGLRNSLNHDPELLAPDRAEVERALDLRGQHLAQEA